MKYCPKCGAPLKATDKFCERCGADVSQINSANVIKADTRIAGKDRSRNDIREKTAKNKRLWRNCLIIAICVILLAAGGVLFFTLQSQNQENAMSQHQELAKRYGTKGKLLPKNTAGFTLSFAHLHFKDNPDWEKAFNEAEAGKLKISSYPEYTFGNYDVKAPNGGAVYVVTPSVGYVVSDVKHPERAQVNFIDSQKGASHPYFFHTVVKKVIHSSYQEDIKTIGQKVIVIDNSNRQDNAAANQSSSSKQSNSQKNDGDQLTWNKKKEKQLANFMVGFGHKMKQHYEEYTGEKEIDTLAGENYPDIFSDTRFELYSDEDEDEEEINIDWDPELDGNADYQVVSIFNCNVGNPEQHITYLFCVHDKKPIVLVDQTTNGGDVKVKETANSDVRDAFAQILTGEN